MEASKTVAQVWKHLPVPLTCSQVTEPGHQHPQGRVGTLHLQSAGMYLQQVWLGQDVQSPAEGGGTS